jgi:hypothetical protein
VSQIQIYCFIKSPFDNQTLLNIFSILS